MFYSKNDVRDRFEALFQDHKEIPDSLFDVWFEMAVARFETEIGFSGYDSQADMFDNQTTPYVLNLLAIYIKQMYQEREVSRINKQISIVGKDLSIDGTNGSKKYAESELEYITSQADIMTHNLKFTAYN